jgi:hypothetical protein
MTRPSIATGSVLASALSVSMLFGAIWGVATAAAQSECTYDQGHRTCVSPLPTPVDCPPGETAVWSEDKDWHCARDGRGGATEDDSGYTPPPRPIRRQALARSYYRSTKPTDDRLVVRVRTSADARHITRMYVLAITTCQDGEQVAVSTNVTLRRTLETEVEREGRFSILWEGADTATSMDYFIEIRGRFRRRTQSLVDGRFHVGFTSPQHGECALESRFSARRQT